MSVALRFGIFAMVTALLACTTVPSRFQRASHIDDNVGFVVEAEDATGFDLETFYHEYSFLPTPDDAIENARALFVRVAQDIASGKGKQVQPIAKSRLSINATRNVADGRYSVYVAGRVNYKR